MKKTLLMILLLLASFGASAQTAKEQSRSYALYFAWNKWAITTDAQREALDKVLAELAGQPEAKISIIGWADKTGSARANRSMSLRRAESVRAYLEQNGIALDRITVSGNGVDTQGPDNAKARRADVTLTFYIQEQPKQPEPKREAPKAEQPKPELQQPVTVVEQVAVVEEITVPRNHFSLRTNLLYWAGGLPNLGAEWMPSPSVGILVNGGWAPWSCNDWKHNWSGWFVSPEVRWYMGTQKRWFVGAQFLTGEYNLKPKNKGYQGSIIAGGITGGYKLRLSECLDMDFSLGLGYGELKYDTYRRSDNEVNIFTGKGITKSSFMPTQAGVSLIWKIK